MAKSYEVHVLVSVRGEQVWKAVRPTGDEPYRFVSRDAADWHLIRGYGQIGRKIVEVDKEPNISLT